MQRRTFLGSSLLALTSTAVLGEYKPRLASGSPQPTLPVTPTPPASPRTNSAPRDRSAQAKHGWELGTQAWTFRDRSAFEAIDTAHMLGLTCIELFPGQQLSPDSKDIKVGPDLTENQRSELKAKLDSAGVRAHSFGVVGFSTNEAAARKIFEFAKAMGMRGISCEPEYDLRAEPPINTWPMVDKLTKEYGLYAACHNHPKPSRYWTPEVFLEAVKGIDSKLIGVCADTGHWERSGLTPPDMLKKFEGRVFELHFKDVKNNIDQPWGTGGGDAKGQLAELKRQGFKGPIFLEYETGAGREIEASAALCIEFFDKTAKELA